MKTHKELVRKYNELAKQKTIIMKEYFNHTLTQESFDRYMLDVNSKMSAIDWVFGEVKDI